MIVLQEILIRGLDLMFYLHVILVQRDRYPGGQHHRTTGKESPKEKSGITNNKHSRQNILK